MKLTNSTPREKHKLNSEIPVTNQVKCGTKNLQAFRPKM